MGRSRRKINRKGGGRWEKMRSRRRKRKEGKNEEQ